MRGALSNTVRACALATILAVLVCSFAACGGEAAVAIQQAPTPTRTPLPEEG